MEMENIIECCNEALDAASGKVTIPGFVGKSCKGVAIITVLETGFIFSMSEGDGIVIRHNDDGTWGPPSAIRFTSYAAGTIFGKVTK